MSDFKLFERYGIELEYMLVDKASLEPQPITDKVLKDLSGEYMQELDRPRINWSNELALHVIEVKNKDPEPDILSLYNDFNTEINSINEHIAKYNSELLPGAVHPWMNPDTAKLWPHSNKEIYAAYDRIFGCKGHGWSNLQSMHINISFKGDREFHQLHSAVRATLPLVPALCSSSPIIDGAKSDYLSSRLFHYLKNQKKIPSIIGKVVPEVAGSEAEYKSKILNPMYKDISTFDTEGILQNEWLNSRGAIAKFKYGCIEIRLADIQENPKKDLSSAQFLVDIIKSIDIEQADKISEDNLKQILLSTAQNADQAVIEDLDYLKLFGIQEKVTANELLQHLLEKLKTPDPFNALKHNIEKGPLSARLLTALNQDFSKDNLRSVYKKLSKCLQDGAYFEG